MKKSNVFMFAYIVFLVIAIIAALAYGWDGLGQTALATSVAAFFFAFADLSSWYVSCMLPHSELFLENIRLLKKYDAAIDDLDSNTKMQANNIIELLQYQVDAEPMTTEIVSLCKNSIARLEQDEGNTAEIKSQLEELIAQSEKAAAKINRIKTWEFGFAYMGFLSLFSLISFDTLVNYIRPYESIITVSAFAVVMLTYFLRDTIDEQVKKKCDMLHEKTEGLKHNIFEMEQKTEELRQFDRVKELAEMIEKENQQKEVAENG